MIYRDRGISHQIFNARTEHLDLLYIKKGYGVYNKDFYFTCIANFNFDHFEIGKGFWLIWVKLQNGRFNLQFLFRVFKECSIQVWASILLILCLKKIKKFEIWVKI